MELNINTIVVLVEFEDGSVRQVLSNKLQKELALRVLIGEDGELRVSKPIKPLKFEEI